MPTIEPGVLEVSTLFTEDDLYLLFNVCEEDNKVVSSVVLTYEQVQNLLGLITDYLIEAEDVYEN